MPPSTIVIPARYTSTRFPGKPLVNILGTSMLERVWRIAKAAGDDNRVLIATDDTRIEEHAKSFGAEVVMTSASCQTGTDRVSEVSKKLSLKDEVVVSFQGDSVLTPPSVLKELLASFDKHPDLNMATPATHLQGAALSGFLKQKEAGSSTGTMVVFDKNFKALYFSRSVIPYSREGSQEEIYRHIGIYAYKAKTLQKLSNLEMSRLEKLEKLEQLRALENGIEIKIVPVDFNGRTAASVDNPEDVEIVESIIKKEGELLSS